MDKLDKVYNLIAKVLIASIWAFIGAILGLVLKVVVIGFGPTVFPEHWQAVISWSVCFSVAFLSWSICFQESRDFFSGLYLKLMCLWMTTHNNHRQSTRKITRNCCKRYKSEGSTAC